MASGEPTDPTSVEALIEVTLERPVAGGVMLARADAGPVVLVAGGLPGERVRVRIDKRAKTRWDGTVVDVIDPSPHRQAPPCPHVVEGCGGCDWQHAAAEHQPELKRAVVIDALTRLGRVVDPSVGVANALPATDYRTTVRGVVGRSGRFSFRGRHSHDATAADGCLVVHPLLRELIDDGRYGDAAEVTLRAGAATGERLALIHPTRAEVSLPDDVRVVGEDELRRGKRAWIHEVIDGRTFRVSAHSFFQARPDGAHALVREVVRMVGDARSGTVIDAYCGVGLFSAFLAGDDRELIGIERNKSSLADARINLAGATARLLALPVESWRASPAAAVVADPARSGLGKAAVDVLSATEARDFVLVSCDPAALGRDVELLTRRGYVLVESVLVDLFPHTHHLEVVSHLTRSEPENLG